MIYKVISGKETGKFIIVDEVDDIGGYAIADDGKKYFIESVREATEEEIKENKNFKVTKLI
ncbi:MAG: hypothetical protein ACRDD8_11410 [Bacteroidales bacterium]